MTGDAPRVLVSEGGSGESRAAVAAVRALANAGYRPDVTVSGDLSLAGASRYCGRRIPVPPVDADPDGYAAAVHDCCASNSYIALFPASDNALLALDLSVRHLLDKVACAAAAERVGLATPPTSIFSSTTELLEKAPHLSYPIIAKPDTKRFMAIRAESPAALRSALAPLAGQRGRIIVQPWLNAGLRGVVGLIWRGRLVECMHMRYHRIWPLPCGTVAAASTVPADSDLEERLTALLADYQGVFHADLMGPYLLDLNPRIHATLPLALASGINPVARYCDLLRGRSVTSARSRPDVYFRWLEGDLRSIGRSLAKGQLSAAGALRALMPRPGTIHSLESWRDPGPLWTRLRYISRRVRHGPARATGPAPSRQALKV